jgi:hypothetical protein
MPRPPGVALLLACIALGVSTAPAAVQAPPPNVILITLDGARTEEIFGGLDLEVLRAGLKKDQTVDQTRAYAQFWADTPQARRARLMPFFWNEWMARHGSIAGNRAAGSRFGIRNTRRFSYPGYAEILTGEPHDAVIDSNDNRRYPFPTLLDVLQQRLALGRDQVAAFGSWETFRWIASSRPDAFLVNAGYQPLDSADPDARRWSREQFEAHSPWDTVRHDMFTFRLALAHLKTARPRVLYLALGETDDWAHDLRYDRVLQTLALTDAWFRQLWSWLQSDAQYRDNTSILITVDHGRGRTPSDWGKHGETIDGAEETWLASIGPAWPRRGEWTAAPDAYATQVAATLARAAGVDLRQDIPGAGPPIDYLWQDGPASAGR